MNQKTPPTAILDSAAFSPLDRHFAALMQKFSGKDCPELILAAALVSRRLAEGHSCFSLGELAGQTFPASPAENVSPLKLPTLASWEKILRATPVVGDPGASTSLILDAAGRLYLQRYWKYERTVAEEILKRRQQPPFALDAKAVVTSLEKLFSASTNKNNWQKVAAFAALRQRFSVIIGGPGTGKTWTVARLLALLLEQPGGESLRVKLAAPTGKAAARLQEALASSIASLACSEAVKTRLLAKDLTTTIHRLLGTIPRSAKFRHDAKNPLPVDVLVVDEASMVSLPLMAKLLPALKPDARLVLVGDQNQLPPVDAGNVLADLCRAAAINGFREPFCNDYDQCGGEALVEKNFLASEGLADTVIQLQTNYRSGEMSALNEINVTVNSGNADAAMKLLQQTNAAALAWQPLPSAELLKTALSEAVVSHYGDVLKSASPAAALAALGKFRILCAVREGPFGTEAINILVEEILAEAGFIAPDKIKSGSYAGKPLMVTANHYALKLFNGDTGVIWRDGEFSSLVYFPDEAGGIHAIARERLAEHEPVYALTIHKSQGSEFDHVLLVLPEKISQVLTRQLFYTGLTRARKSVHILAPENILRAAIATQLQRSSGLTDALRSVVKG
ncbi:MAG: exodeoxyribonuclease V subunit alpha [Verrucomicrobiae bacterium]